MCKNNDLPKKTNKTIKIKNNNILPYNKNDNFFKDKMNNLVVEALNSLDINPIDKCLILDGINNRTARTLIKNSFFEKKNIESVECDKDTYLKHIEFGISSNFVDLKDYVKDKKDIPYKFFCCDGLASIHSTGIIILESIENNIISDGSIFLVTFSKRSKTYGDIFYEELHKWYKKLETLLESKNLYLMNFPNLDKTNLEYAGKHQSAMYSELFLIGTDKNKKRQINYESSTYEPEKIISHKGSYFKLKKMKFIVKWKGFDETTEEPWINIKNCDVFHKYAISINMKKKLIPNIYK